MAKEDKFDVAIIGAGPAGLMAACQSAGNGRKVVLIEKNSSIGKKLLLTGNGRCNLTNAEFDLKKLVKNYNNGEFLFHAFSVFGPKEAIRFFEDIGLKTKIEKDKRVFPKSNDSEEVLEVLVKYLENKNVKIILNSEVADIKIKNKKLNKLVLSPGEIVAENYIFCTGGKSYPLTGSTGAGYELAKNLGHSVIKPMPALSPIKLKEEWIGSLQGISLKDVKISVYQGVRKQFCQEGEIMFTNSGVSGPAVLNISGRIGNLLEAGGVKMYVDLFPLLNQEQLLKGIEDILNKYPNKTIKNILSIFVPERLSEVLLDIMKISKDKIANSMEKTERLKVINIFKKFELTPEEIFGFENAIVTRGGISLKEIDHKTMKSKIIDNLFFAGEIIDVDGQTGGYNLQACWSTGYLAGKSVQ